MSTKYRSLDHDKLKQRRRSIISTEHALKDVTPINWSKKVLSGEKTVVITRCVKE